MTRPQPAPTASATKTITIQCVSSAIVWVATVVHQTDDSATIAPTERSMPPPMITNVMPMLTTPIVAASLRIVRVLAVDANRSPAVITPDEAQQQQRDDEAEVAAHAACAAGRASVGLAGGLERGLLDAHAVLAHCRMRPFLP